jgi:hypothetical protein
MPVDQLSDVLLSHNVEIECSNKLIHEERLWARFSTILEKLQFENCRRC